MVPITFYRWLNLQFNMPLLSLVIICICDLPFIGFIGYLISIKYNDYNYLLVKTALYDVFGFPESVVYYFINAYNSFIWANLIIYYSAEVIRFHKDKNNKSYSWNATLEFLTIPERMMATPRDMVLYFHIFSIISCIGIYNYIAINQY